MTHGEYLPKQLIKNNQFKEVMKCFTCKELTLPHNSCSISVNWGIRRINLESNKSHYSPHPDANKGVMV